MPAPSRTDRWRLAAPTRSLGTFNAYAWYQLATDKRASELSTGAKLVYLAVAHHGDHASFTGDGYHGSTSADVAVFTGLPLAAIVPVLRRLHAAGWLDGDPHGRCRPTSAVYTFARGGDSVDATHVTCTRCLAEVPTADTSSDGDALVCGQCQSEEPAPTQPPTGKE